MKDLNAGSGPHRHWLVVFTLLLLLVSAAPVLAEADSGTDAAGSTAPTGAGGSLVPDAADLAKAEARLKTEEAQRKRELEVPAAAAERSRSATAYMHLASAQEAGDLLRSSFPEELARLEVDPARRLTSSQLKRNLGDTAALISSEGRTEIMEAGLPPRVKREGGELEKVDLSLSATSDGFEPENPISEVDIPASADEGVSIGDGAIAITQASADPGSAGRIFDETDVIYPEVQADTDLMVAPTSTGVELFDQLRSPESPETLRFDLDLPPGAQLRANAGGAEVWEGERWLATVSAPYAVDAQGTSVPVTMAVEGNSLVLDVPHREGDYAYPILLDPDVQNNWVSQSWEAGYNYGPLEDSTFGLWYNNPIFAIQKWCYYACWGSGRGLFVSAKSG